MSTNLIIVIIAEALLFAEAAYFYFTPEKGKVN